MQNYSFDGGGEIRRLSYLEERGSSARLDCLQGCKDFKKAWGGRMFVP